MPLLKLQTTQPIPKEKQAKLLTACSKHLSEITGKPESYVMVIFESATAALMAGKPVSAALVDIRGIGGLPPPVNKKLSKAICDLLQAELGIRPENVYLNFTEIAATNWGSNGGTFG